MANSVIDVFTLGEDMRYCSYSLTPKKHEMVRSVHMILAELALSVSATGNNILCLLRMT
jgi:hypothetical protein